MTSPTDQLKSIKPAWILAIFTAWLGAAILFGAEPGINWPIWVATASISLVLARFLSVRRVETPLIVLVTWATVLSIAFALTATDFHHAWIVLSDAMLLGLATITLGAENWGELSARLLAAVPFLAPLRVAGASARAAADAPSSVSSPRTRALIRGSIISVPLVVVLIALLASADPLIQWGTNRIAEWLPDWSFPPRLVFFLFLLTLTLGANVLATRQLVARLPQFPTVGTRYTVGLTEQRMVLWSAAVVLWLFVVLQVSYLIHPPPAAIGSGVTFAEFARRGFGELSFAVTIVSAIIIVLEFARPAELQEADRLVLRRLELGLVVALELILLSAFRRVILYEQAYGFTEARVFAQAYMIVVALAIAALAWEIRNGRISVAFGRRVAEIALGVLTILVFWNYHAWIVNKNIDRAIAGEKFDITYLTQRWPDAIPTLVARRNEIPAAERAVVENYLACRRLPPPLRWYEWNRGIVAMDRALRSQPRQPCPGARPVTPASSASAADRWAS